MSAQGVIGCRGGLTFLETDAGDQEDTRPDGGYPSSATRMMVLPGARRPGANAAGALASGRTSPTIGLMRPSLSRG